MKNLQFLNILKESLQVVEKSLKCYRNFPENLGKNLESFGNMHFWGVGGGAELAKLLKPSRKINGNLQTFENFHEL